MAFLDFLRRKNPSSPDAQTAEIEAAHARLAEDRVEAEAVHSEACCVEMPAPLRTFCFSGLLGEALFEYWFPTALSIFFEIAPSYCQARVSTFPRDGQQRARRECSPCLAL